MVMRTLLVTVAIILLASLVLNGWFIWDRHQTDKNQAIRNWGNDVVIAQHIATAQTAARRADSLQASFEIRHTKDSLALSALSVRNKAKSKKVDSLRVPVQPLIDSIQALGAFVQAYDSLLAGKNEEIKQLEERHIGQILDLHALIKEKTSQIMAQIAVSETLGQVVTNLEGEVKKERRGKRFWQVVGGVLAVGIVVQSVR